jgi:nitrate reductase NapA
MTRRIPDLYQAVPKGYVELHPEDARAINVLEGDRIKIESRRGEESMSVIINGRGHCPRGTVFVPFFDENILINKVTLDAFCPISKQPDYKKCAVRIIKV